MFNITLILNNNGHVFRDQLKALTDPRINAYSYFCLLYRRFVYSGSTYLGSICLGFVYLSFF
jgi:hypothetical protein